MMAVVVVSAAAVVVDAAVLFHRSQFVEEGGTMLRCLGRSHLEAPRQQRPRDGADSMIVDKKK